MKTTKLFLCLLLAIVPWAADAAFTVSVSPGTIAWDSNTWVNVRITNNAAQGYAANLTIYIDPDTNGVVGPMDVPLFSVTLRDGRTNRFGAVTIPDDDDGITNRAILTRIPCFGIDNPLHTVGRYIVQVAFTNGTSPAVTTFTVTQPTTTVYITGRVLRYGDDAPIGAAFLDIYPFTRAAGFTPGTWTDTNGAFRLYLPPSMTGNVQGIVAGGFGYFSVPYRDDIGEWISGYRFQGDLHAGDNALTNSLRLVVADGSHVHSLSGQVVDGETNPIPFALVMFEEDSEDDSDAGSLAVADINGNFSLPVPDGMTGWVGAEGGFLNLRGFVASGNGPYTVTQDISGIVVECPAATILARNLVIDSGTGAGVAGVGAGFEADMYWSSAYSVTGGLYEIGLVSETYKAGIEDDMLPCLGYSGASGYEGLAITNAGIYTNVPFYLMRGYPLSGTVFDRQTNTLTDGKVQVNPFGSWNGNDVDVNRHGVYVMLAATGSYQVTAEDFAGYLSQRYTNHFTWEWDNGPVADPVIVSTNGATNINFFLPAAAYIRGTVLGTNSPMENVQVEARVRVDEDNIEGRGNTQTGPDGSYELAVPAGADYIVGVQAPNGTFFLPQYWSNKMQDSEADLVATDTNAPAENINFNLQLGGRIEGAVYEPDGSTPLIHTWGFVEAQTTNDISDFAGGDDIDQDDGTYGFTVAPGIYHLRAQTDGWPDQYYAGVPESQRDLATPVTVEVSQVTIGIDFTMLVPSYIEGNVTDDFGPVSGMQVQVSYVSDTNNWWTSWVGQGNSDASGYYSVEVPPGTNYIVSTQPDDSSCYLQQYWSNATIVQDATLVEVTNNMTLSGIDFSLELGARIEGQVWNELGDPMESVQIEAHRFDTNGSTIWGGGSQTDGDGTYGFVVPVGTGYFVRAGRPWSVSEENWWYPETFYSNKFSEPACDHIRADAGATVSNVDFHLALGYRVEGFVYDSDGVSPAPNGFVFSEETSGPLHHFGATQCEGDGSYQVCLPNHLPLHLCGTAQDRVPEYYDNVYSGEQATAIQPAAMTTTRVDFALYSWTEDADGDGLFNYQEDTRPDGVFNPIQDWSSYVTNHTDGDQINDRDERDWDINPQLPDTDGDTFTDWQETYVTGTDATASPSGSNSYLHCLQTTRVGTDVIVNWSAVEYAGNYYIQRSTNLTSGASWIDLFGPMSGTGAVMTVTDINAPPNSAYRVRIPYIAP